MSNLMDEPAAGPETTVPVRPMDVVALRLVSAWAGLMPNEHIQVAYDGAPSARGELTLVGPDSTRTAAQVVIPASTRAKAPRMASLGIQIGYQSHQHPLDDYAAAFWSESAVEKFVVPYLSALGGPRAMEMLDFLDAAWNRYDPARKVFALLLRSRPRTGGSMDGRDLLDVLYLDGERTQRIASLRDFTVPGAPSACRPSPVLLDLSPSAAPASTPALPTEYELRVMAEWVSALRTEPRYFIYNTVGGEFKPPVAACPHPLPAGSVVIPVHTGRTRPDRVVPDVVTLTPAGDGAQSVQFPAPEGDAAFWTAAAVSKVMIPYYAMAYGAEALAELADIHRTWEGSAPLAQAEAGNTGAGVYGLVHLPRSDWGYETTSGFLLSIKDTVSAVVVGPDGSSGMRRFSELRGRPR
ncbi:hypothetical protein [Longimicrobium sp.]|uniref:hypothetical protein n=1 Tax=Longimicrobium sp. TaxID=2029185 RepID=UPI002E309867|nr:hypothetical protein [Longimicrobium sp.]HEX6036543.1 hypothetical protein [Longimicrobium sp.]